MKKLFRPEFLNRVDEVWKESILFRQSQPSVLLPTAVVLPMVS